MAQRSSQPQLKPEVVQDKTKIRLKNKSNVDLLEEFYLSFQLLEEENMIRKSLLVALKSKPLQHS